MKKIQYIIILVLAIGSFARSAYGVVDLGKGYYPYNPRWLDFYVGLGVSTDADTSIGKPDYSNLYNPLKVFQAGSLNLMVGLRPVALLPVLGDLRFEAEGQYRYSRYPILKKSGQSNIDQNSLPNFGQIAIHRGKMLNAYYDVRWFSKLVYMFVGAGFGLGDLSVTALDFNLLPNGVGEEYYGSKKNVKIKQFMVGFEYNTKIIKSATFIEYRYISSGSIAIHPTYEGTEGGSDEKAIDLPKGYVRPQNRVVSYSAHSIMVGLKYYLY